MTKEQEDSIEILENTDISTIELAENTDLYTYSIAVKNVLNMLKEKDSEIQFQKDINKQEKDRHKQAEKSLKGQIKKLNIELKIVDDECSRLERKEVKQDKMIDLYIDELVTNMFDRCCQECCRECEKDKDTLRNCTKQYFERKVENGRL